MAEEKENIKSLYADIDSNLDSFIEGNKSYFEFRDDINRGEDAYTYSKVKIDRDVDSSWVDKIEDAIIALDTIVRAPRNFIKDVEEIVPIEMTRKITSESVKHLATHTNFIQSVEGDMVTPNKILNIYKEESYATYENRFIKTLLQHLEIFIEKRYLGLISQKDVNNRTGAIAIQKFQVGDETIDYRMEINVSAPSIDTLEDKAKTGEYEGIANSVQRVERVRKIIHEFTSGPFMGLLKDAPPVKPPIQKTNLLTKNQDYKKALELWQFIESYTAKGYDVKFNEEANVPRREYIERMVELSYIEYLYLKKFTGEDVDESLKKALEEQIAYINISDRNVSFTSGGGGKGGAGKYENGSSKNGLTLNSRNYIKKEFAKMLGHYTDDLEEVRTIFTIEYEKQQRAIKKEEKKLEDALRRIIKRQKEFDLREIKLQKEKEKREKEREEARQKALELKAQKLEEKRIRDEERAKEREEKRIQKEIRDKELAEAREKARLAREEKAKEAKLKKMLNDKPVEKEKESPAEENKVKKMINTKPVEKAKEEKAEDNKLDKFSLARAAINRAVIKAKTADSEEKAENKAELDTLSKGGLIDNKQDKPKRSSSGSSKSSAVLNALNNRIAKENEKENKDKVPNGALNPSEEKENEE